MSDKHPLSKVNIGCRTVRLGSAIYMRLEDVAFLIREFGTTEETDVRTRAAELANNIQSLYGDGSEKVG